MSASHSDALVFFGATGHSNAKFNGDCTAKHAGNDQLASFYAERFPSDVKKAYDAWLAQKPFELLMPAA